MITHEERQISLERGRYSITRTSSSSPSPTTSSSKNRPIILSGLEAVEHKKKMRKRQQEQEEEEDSRRQQQYDQVLEEEEEVKVSGDLEEEELDIHNPTTKIAIRKRRYQGKNSEGNRYITNNDL